MTTPHRLFKARKFEFAGQQESAIDQPHHVFRKEEARTDRFRYTFSPEKGVLHSIHPRAMQKLTVMGCTGEYIGNLMHAVAILESYSNRKMNPAVFEQVKQRYGIGMGTMTSLAAMSSLELSDMGVDLRGLVRFYVRHRKQIRDLDELERFVSWLRARGECVTGVPGAWRHFRSLGSHNGRGRHATRRHNAKKYIQ